jgi:aspartate carbamoyltransferase catalytic subunit
MALTSPWNHRHLLGLEPLNAAEITTLLDHADSFLPTCRDPGAKRSDLAGKCVVNLFFENSTRTRVSFGLAARRLGAEVIDFAVGGSSVSKGETFVDTARNIEALGIHMVVVRHSCPGTPHLLAQNIRAGVVNAGDGAHEHPTQGLLDLLTIRQRLGRIDGLTVALVGDICHSRVARSNIHGLLKLGARVIVCGPPTLVPLDIQKMGVEVEHDLDRVLPECHVLNVLRIQFERQKGPNFPGVREYFHLYGVTAQRLARARKGVLVLAPGPINRGVELTPEVADGPSSAVLDQVTNGLAVRMAVLDACVKAAGK